jgi:hypothetical protein
LRLVDFAEGAELDTAAVDEDEPNSAKFFDV